MITSTQNNSGWREVISWHPKMVVLLLYIILSIGITWPLSLHLNSSVFGDFGDTRGGIWGVWSTIQGFRTSTVCPLLSAPHGVNMGQIPTQPVFEWPVVFASKIIGEVAAYNIYVILAFSATAFTTFLLLNYLLKNRFAAFFGGLIFGFCPGAVMQAVGGHHSYSMNMFIPLLLIALFYNRKERNLLSVFFVGLCYALVTLNALYFGFFSIFIIILFIIFDYASTGIKKRRKLFINYFLAAVFAAVIIVPFQYKFIVQQLTRSSVDLMKIGHVRSVENLLIYSARPLEYFLPSIDHPVLGDLVGNYFRNHLHGSNLFEQTLYLGFVPLSLCVIGFFIFIKNRYPRDIYAIDGQLRKRMSDGNLKRQHYFLFFIAGIILTIFLSFPPKIPIGDIQLPTLSYLTFKIAPMFRVYARFGILANFFMACATAVVLTEISERMQRKRYYLLLALLLPFLIFEYWSIPPHFARSIDPPPAVYQWLSKEPGDFIIAEYPMMNSDHAAFYTYLFWQRIHKKRMVNGASPDNAMAWDLYKKVNDLSDFDTPRLLRSIGVKYIIVHKQMYQEGEIPGPLKRYYPPDVSARSYNDGKVPINLSLGEPFMIFDDDVVYLLDRQWM